jgi:hypothetical protein
MKGKGRRNYQTRVDQADMARIGALSIGGRGRAPGTPAVFGVSFDLTRNPAADFLYRPDGSPWEIELKAGQGSVVARTTERLERSALSLSGSGACAALPGYRRL